MNDITMKEPAVNWASIDTEVKHEGKQIVLPADPANMSYETAIETLERVKEQESQKFDVREVIKGAPWDALYATYKACQQIYGVVTNHSIKTWFGDIKPVFATINVGPGANEKIQVPYKLMRVPGVSEPFYLDFAGTEGAILYGTVNKKDQTRLVEIANLARKIIRENSIYKTKAIRLSVDDDGDLDMANQPEFLDLKAVGESDMIHTRETEALIQTNIFSPLKNTEGCRRHKIPLKRGILLEGRYGTGKSLTARVTAKVATDNGWTFIMLDRAKGLKSAIEFARAYQPCVIFAEDIDRAADREDEDVNDLVNLIDGVISKDMEMMVVLTTNFIENIDQALLRPGRFDAVISIMPPDAETSLRLVRQYARELLSDDVDLSEVGELTANQTPAVIREVVERAKLSMLTENRAELSARDLYVSALGMKQHMDLLKPKVKEVSPRDKFVDGLVELLMEAAGTGANGGVDRDTINGATMDIKRSVAVMGKKVLDGVGGAVAASTASVAKGEEILEETKKISSKLKR